MLRLFITFSLISTIFSFSGFSPFNRLKSMAACRRHGAMRIHAPKRAIKERKRSGKTQDERRYSHKHIQLAQTLYKGLSRVSIASFHEDTTTVKREFEELYRLIRQSGFLGSQGKLLRRIKTDTGVDESPTDCFVRELKKFMDSLIDAMNSLQSLSFIQLQRDIASMIKTAQEAANCW